jgi:hypothetical protein
MYAKSPLWPTKRIFWKAREKYASQRLWNSLCTMRRSSSCPAYLFSPLKARMSPCWNGREKFWVSVLIP